MREYLGYVSTLDRFTYVIMEIRSVPRAFTKSGYTCKNIKIHAIRIHLKKRLRAGLMFEIEFKTIVSLLLNRNPTC